MKNIIHLDRIWPALLICTAAFGSCGSPVQLTSSWSQADAKPAPFSKILVVSFARNAERQKLGEDHLKSELQRHGLTAFTSLEVFDPSFTDIDSAKMNQLLLDKHFDGLVTLRVLKVDQQDTWEHGSVLFQKPGYTIANVSVQLQSDLYRVDGGKLLWWGRSTSFTTDPTEAMAARYARNIVLDMIRRKVLIANSPAHN
jgi:hypothetical protein